MTCVFFRSAICSFSFYIAFIYGSYVIFILLLYKSDNHRKRLVGKSLQHSSKGSFSKGFDSSEVGLRVQLSQIGAPSAVTISYTLFKRFSGKFNQKLENLAEETGQDFLADSMAS